MLPENKMASVVRQNAVRIKQFLSLLVKYINKACYPESLVLTLVLLGIMLFLFWKKKFVKTCKLNFGIVKN